jgi:predicted permease
MTRFFAHMRHAARVFARQPLFTLTAVLSLAIGIGANTTIFSVANALLIAPTAGLEAPDRLVDLGTTRNGRGFDTMGYQSFVEMRDRTRTLSGMFGLDIEPSAFSLGHKDGALRVFGQYVTAGFFDVLGLKPAVGGVFHLAEEVIGTPLRKVVISDRLWRRQFGADAMVAGREILLNGDTFVIAGVTPPRFHGTTIIAPDLWVPVTAHANGSPSESMLRAREGNWLIAGGRMKPGVTIDQVRAELRGVFADLRAQFPDAVGTQDIAVMPASRLPGDTQAEVAPIIAVLASIVGLVLLVACTNLAGLLLARAAARSKEMAVRVALGATRRDLVRQLLAESVLLFALGGAAAALFAYWMNGVLVSMLPSLPFPVEVQMAFDWRVAAFTVVLAIVAGLGTGLIPALHSSRPDLTSSMKADASAPSRQRLRHAVVSTQMGFCLLLLVMAGLLLRALSTAASVDPGFRTAGIDVASLDLSIGGIQAPQRVDVTERLRERVAAIPGVASVAIARMTPLDGGGLGLGALRKRGSTANNEIEADWNVISPEFLPTLALPLTAGRNFTPADREGAPGVAIVSQKFAATMWPGEDPLGKVLENGDFRPGRGSDNRLLTVVGVARDAKYRWIGESTRAFIYVPAKQFPSERLRLMIARDPRADASADLTTAVRQAIREVAPNLPLINLVNLKANAALGLLPQTIAATVAGALGSLALLLAAIGIYGVTAYAVARRTREIGVRMALGADRGDVTLMVLMQGLRITAIGGAVGLVAAGAAAYGLASADILFGVSALDPIAFGATTVTLMLVALIAAYLPARKAASIDPLVALRNE